MVDFCFVELVVLFDGEFGWYFVVFKLGDWGFEIVLVCYVVGVDWVMVW